MTSAHFESFRARPNRWDVSLTAPRAVHVAHRLDEVVPLLEEAEREGSRSWVAVALSYDAAPALDPNCKARQSNGFPLAWAAVFDSECSPPEQCSKPFTISRWSPAVSSRHYADSIRSIRERIERGDVYQVNYTFPLLSEFHGDPWSCYQLLGRRQEAGYSAYLEIGDFTVLSFSPELLIERTGKILSTRPMKGTARRGSPLDDHEKAEKLRQSVKDRAENAMIVDLMRNDLSRVARLGTVGVPEMFAVEPY